LSDPAFFILNKITNYFISLTVIVNTKVFHAKGLLKSTLTQDQRTSTIIAGRQYLVINLSQTLYVSQVHLGGN
jgi:hypothetical protein